MHYLSQSVAILLALFILILWFTHKKTGSSSEPIFLLLIGIALVSSILDLFTQFAIAPYPTYSPEIVTEIVIKSYLFSLIAYMSAMGLYLQKSFNIVNKGKKTFLLNVAILLVASVIMCVIETDYVYYIDCSIVQGPIILYVNALSILSCIVYLYIIHKNRSNRSRWVRVVAIVWIISFPVGLIFQQLTIERIFLPIVSVNTVVGIMFLFLCNENPGSKYDYLSDRFFYDIFIRYIQDIIANKNNQSCLMVNMRVKNHDNIKYCNDIYKKIITNKENSDIRFFNGAGSELYICSNELDRINRIKSTIIHQIKEIEKNNIQVKFYTTMIVVPDIKIVDSFQVLKAIFDTYRSKEINDENDFVEKQVDLQMVEEYKRKFLIIEEVESAVRNDRVEVEYINIHNHGMDKIYAQANSNIRLNDNSILKTDDYYEIAVEYNLLKDIRDIKLKSIDNTIRTIISNNNHKLGMLFLHTSVQELEIDNYYEEYISAFNGDVDVMSKTCLEITNIEKIVRKDVLLNNIAELQKYGVKFAVAGFGSGEANLNYFIDLPLQYVRYDKSIIDNATKDKHALLIMKDINELARSLNFEVIATGDDENKASAIMKECEINSFFDDTTPMIDENSFINLCLDSKGGNK